MTEDELFELTPDQQRAFNRFKKAVKDCERLGVVFYCVLDNIGAIDGNKFDSFDPYDDEWREGGIENFGQNCLNEISNGGFDSFADDNHYFHPRAAAAKGE